MRAKLALGAALLVAGAFAAIHPSLTGAVVDTPDKSTLFLLSLPFIALGAAVIANALRTILAPH